MFPSAFNPYFQYGVQGNGSFEGLAVEGFLPLWHPKLVHQQAEKPACLVGYAVRKVALIDVACPVLGDDLGKRDILPVGEVHNAEIIADVANTEPFLFQCFRSTY